MTSAVGYYRVSSAGQRDRHTIASQDRDVPAYCAAQGWPFVGSYRDDGLSAKTGKLDARLDYARLLADAKAGRLPDVVVVVVAFDRFTRSEDPVERAMITGNLTRAGLKIAIVGAGIQDPRTLAGDLYLAFMGVLAAHENRIKSARTIAGQITAIERKRKPRGPTPYGYCYDRATGVWSVDEAHAAVIREAFERTAAGVPSQRISTDFDRRGLPSPGRASWASVRLHRLISSDIYLGDYAADRQRGLSIALPPIVDRDLAEDARAAMTARYHKPPPPTVHHRLLAGLARCETCHEPIGLCATGTLTSYRCRGRRIPRATGRCTMPLVRVAIDAWIWEDVVDTMARRDVMDRAIAMLAARRTDPGTLEAATQALDGAKRAQEAAVSRIERGLIPAELADDHLRQLAARRAAAISALRDAQAQAIGVRPVTDPALIEEHLRLMRLCAEQATPAQRHTYLALWSSAVTVLRPADGGDRARVAVDMRIDVPTQVDSPSCSTGAPVSVPIGRLIVLAPPVLGRWGLRRRTA